MATKSDIVSLDGTNIPSGVTGQLIAGTPEVDPVYEDRDGAPATHTATIRSPIDVEVQFKWTTYAQSAALRAWLGFPDKTDPRPLVIQGGDWGSLTQVTADATVVSVGIDLEGGGTPVTFRFADPVWKAVTATTEGPFSYTGTDTETITVVGETTALPLVKVGWSVQRGASNALIGWTYAREIVVTNNSTQALHNYPIQLGPINTASLVAASKLEADNDDLVVFNDKGERLRRATAGTNTRGTFLWFVVDELAAGASRTYTVAYGNSAATYTSATQGFGLTYPGSPVIDLTAIDGQATAATASTLSTGKTLETNQFIGATMLLVAADASNQGGQYRRIASHTTGGVFTVTRDFSATPDTNTGYVVVGAGFMGDGGVVSSSGSTSLSDSSQAWSTNEWIGATVEEITLDTTIGTVVQSAEVLSNSATQLVVASWPSGTPATSSIYRVYKRNANWIYRTEFTSRPTMNHRGRWRINTATRRPSQMWFAADGAPASWSLTTYNPGNAAYDYNQPRATTSSSEWFAGLNVRVARKDGAKLPEEGFANGVELYCPLGILGVKHDFGVQNPDGMARCVFGAREGGGEDWELYHEYSTTQSSLVDRPVAYYNLTDYGTPRHLLAALTSDDDADIEKTQKETARLREGAVLEVRVDPRNLSVTNWEDATEHEVYDVSLRIRRGGASEAVGDDLILIGGDEHHLFLKADEEVWVGPYQDWPLITRVYDTGDYVRDVPNSVDIYHVDADWTGDADRVYSATVLPLTPGSTELRVADPDGTWGTMTVTYVYSASYL